MNTEITDFVSKRTDPYFFNLPEEAELADILSEVQRSIEDATDEMTFEVDLSLMKQAEEVLAAKGWTLEEAVVLYLYWLAVSPKKDKEWNESIGESFAAQTGSNG